MYEIHADLTALPPKTLPSGRSGVSGAGRRPGSTHPAPPDSPSLPKRVSALPGNDPSRATRRELPAMNGEKAAPFPFRRFFRKRPRRQGCASPRGNARAPDRCGLFRTPVLIRGKGELRKRSLALILGERYGSNRNIMRVNVSREDFMKLQQQDTSGVPRLDEAVFGARITRKSLQLQSCMTAGTLTRILAQRGA
jgi:hypothetical protein